MTKVESRGSRARLPRGIHGNHRTGTTCRVREPEDTAKSQTPRKISRGLHPGLLPASRISAIVIRAPLLLRL